MKSNYTKSLSDPGGYPIVELLCRSFDLPRPEREYKFAKPKRKWRFDFAWPEYLLAMEIEGGIFVRGRHTRPMGFKRDMEKYNAAAMLGYKVLRFTPDEVKNGSFVDFLILFFQDFRKKNPQQHGESHATENRSREGTPF